jgi:hypothetical protein
MHVMGMMHVAVSPNQTCLDLISRVAPDQARGYCSIGLLVIRKHHDRAASAGKARCIHQWHPVVHRWSLCQTCTTVCHLDVLYVTCTWEHDLCRVCLRKQVHVRWTFRIIDVARVVVCSQQ